MEIDSNLPEDIMLDILRRLPVKTLIRFKLVCKSWSALPEDPHFITSHLAYTKTCTSNNHSLLRLSKYKGHVLVHIHIDSTQTNDPVKYTYHQIPKNYTHYKHMVSLNGVVCLSGGNYPRHYIVLWNPAMKLVKPIPNPPNDSQLSGKRVGSMLFSLCFDQLTSDLQIIRMVSYTSHQPDGYQTHHLIDMYSCQMNAWKEIGNIVSGMTCEIGAIVKGTPYWCFTSDDNLSIVGVDVHKGVLKHVSNFPGDLISVSFNFWTLGLVNWMDSLAVWVDLNNVGDYVGDPSLLNKGIQIYTLDEESGAWSKKCVVKPFDRLLSQLPNLPYAAKRILLGIESTGDLIIDDFYGNLFFLRSNTNELTYLIDGSSFPSNPSEWYKKSRSSLVTGYTESLFSVKGMEQLKDEDSNKIVEEMDKLEEDDNKKISSRTIIPGDLVRKWTRLFCIR